VYPEPTSDCDCTHPKEDHPHNRGCISEGCDCTYYDGCVEVHMVHLVETDEGW
jgi:hypothetical protein